MRTLVIIVVLILLAIAGTVAFIFSGAYDVAATTPHSALVKWALSTTSDHSVDSRAVSVEVPQDYDAPSRVAAGAIHYAETCQGCHGGPGAEAAELAKGLNPPAPDLVESGREMSAQQVYWVIKHGIKMTGMPGFGPTHDEQELWAMTAFVKALPDMSPARYAELTKKAEEEHQEGDEATAAGAMEPATAAGTEHPDSAGAEPAQGGGDQGGAAGA